MYINESLANGLKDRLWNEIDDLGTGERRLSQYIKTHKIKLGSRTAWRKLDQVFQIGYEHSILASVKSGTRESPLLLYAILGRNRQADLNDWQEKMFSIFYASIDVWGTMSEPSSEVVRIGEHAVSRFFQRHPEIYNQNTGDFEIFKIIPEFRSIAFLGQSMFLLFSALTGNYKHSLENISIPFVTKSGIFLANYNKQLRTCDVRTFIANHQLSRNQVALATQVRAIFENDIFVGLPFVGHLRAETSNFIELYLFLAKLCPVGHQFADLVTWNEENLMIKREFQQLIIEHLREYEPYDQTLKKHTGEIGNAG